VTYHVDFAITLTAPARTKLLKVWLPLPPSDAGQEVTGREISTFPAVVQPKLTKESRFGNEFAYFEFADPQGAQGIRHRFTAKVYEQRWGVDPARVMRVDRWPAAFDPYLQPDRAVAVDDRLRKLLGEVVPEAKGPAADLAAAMDWLAANMTYGPLPSDDRASS